MYEGFVYAARRLSVGQADVNSMFVELLELTDPIG
jgi:hypothetical protein